MSSGLNFTRAAVLKKFAAIGEAISVEDWPVQEPGKTEVLVEMAAAPVNPADINIIEGQYGELPELPAVIGNEGAGKVIATGSEVRNLVPGDLVVLLQRGTWAGHVTLPEEEVFKLPADLDPLQASLMAVNPPTALLMLEKFADLKPGDWIVQNAANSAVGRCVIQIAHSLGFKTLNVVRREELIEELKSLGADEVVTDSVDLRKEAKALLNGGKARLGLNAVGGQSALNISNALSAGSPLVTYGGMARQPLKVPNGLLIFKDLRFVGFWLTRWKNTADAQERERVFGKLAEWVRSGSLRIAVHSTHPLENLQEALTEAMQSSRDGKVLLLPNAR